MKINFEKHLEVADVWAALRNVHPNTLMRAIYKSREFYLDGKKVTILVDRICRLNIDYNNLVGVKEERKTGKKKKNSSWMTHPYAVFTVVAHKTTGAKYLQITNPVKPKQTKVRYYLDGKLVRDNATKKIIEAKQKELGLTPPSIEGVKSFLKPLDSILKIEKYKK